MDNQLSVCAWSLPGAVPSALRTLRDMGFEWIDVEPHTLLEANARDAAADLGLRVSCMAIDHGMPDGTALDASDPDAQRRSWSFLTEALDRCRDLSGTTAYVTPHAGADRARTAATIGALAEYAETVGVRLTVEHNPGWSHAPTVEGTLAFVEEIDHGNLRVLIDVGHCLISGEDPADAVRGVGASLGYVHWDDNDGEGDLHWALGAGKLTREVVSRALEAVRQGPYDGFMALELMPTSDDPVGAMKKSRRLLVDLLQ